MKVYEGNLVGTGLNIGIVVSRFNSFVTQKLLGGAVDALTRHGVSEDNISVVWTPGTFEMPLTVKRLIAAGGLDAVCCLGAVIRGGTPHFDFVATQVARGVAQTSYDSGVPVTFGVLTTDTIEQAIERAGTKAGNKGFDAAVSAIEMAQLISGLPQEG